MQEVKIVAVTKEVSTEVNKEELRKEMQTFSGKAAGVCYMPDDYLDEGIQNEEKALARALGNSKSGHHSVYDHSHLSLMIKTNKMMAMILNSLGVYTTSEKSARYTKMKPETELELTLYNKWREKIQQAILNKYPDIDDTMLSKRLCKAIGIEESNAVINGSVSHIKSDEFLEEELNKLKKSDTLPSYKLAQENARYMISVFTPTTMMYTISFRQLNLIVDYLYKLHVNCKHATDSFSKKLDTYVVELFNEFEKVLGENVLHDNKNQHIRFLEAQHVGELIGNTNREFEPYSDLEARLKAKKQVYGDSYTAVYYGSLAMLAQEQRHRTIRYTMKLQETDLSFYIPEIVKDAGLSDEWLDDIQSVSYCFPQGTLVRITEQGVFEDFALKCKERLCGRAQLEIMKQTVETAGKFIENKDNLSYENRKLLESMVSEDKIQPRCKFSDFRCSEGCNWGPAEAFTRLI